MVNSRPLKLSHINTIARQCRTRLNIRKWEASQMKMTHQVGSCQNSERRDSPAMRKTNTTGKAAKHHMSQSLRISLSPPTSIASCPQVVWTWAALARSALKRTRRSNQAPSGWKRAQVSLSISWVRASFYLSMRAIRRQKSTCPIWSTRKTKSLPS